MIQDPKSNSDEFNIKETIQSNSTGQTSVASSSQTQPPSKTANSTIKKLMKLFVFKKKQPTSPGSHQQSINNSVTTEGLSGDIMPPPPEDLRPSNHPPLNINLKPIDLEKAADSILDLDPYTILNQPAAAPPSILPSAPVESPPISLEKPVAPATSPDPSVQPKVKRSFVIFSMATSAVVIITIVLGVILFLPTVGGILNKTNAQQQQFQDTLVKSLQVQNQEIKIEFNDNQIANILSSFEDGQIDQASIQIINKVKMQHLSQPLLSQAQFEMRYDFIIQTKSESSNIVLGAVAMLDDNNQTLLKIEEFSIDDQHLPIGENSLNRWTNLTDFLDSQNGLKTSEVLSYIETFLRHYNPYLHLTLLPVFNIESSQDYALVEEKLLSSSAFDLDENSCQNFLSSKWECKIEINYQDLYNFYSEVYVDIFDQEVPQYYEHLKATRVPTGQYIVVFDGDRQQFISLSNIVDSKSEELSIIVDFENFNDSNFSLVSPTELLDIVEYNRQLVELENELFLVEN